MSDKGSGAGSSTTLVLGSSGQLGRAFVTFLGERALPFRHDELDISDRSNVKAIIERSRPRFIVNCAAATDVDRCETDHEYADRANWYGPGTLAELATDYGVRLAHVSTDFVFGGDLPTPYTETDVPRPVNYYGLSKLRGEHAVLSACPEALVVRTSWLFGRGGSNFPQKVLEWAVKGEPLRIVTDHKGSPTYAFDLAWAMSTLLDRGISGLVHLAGSGCATRFELASETLRLVGSSTAVHPASASEFSLRAARPAQTCLDCSKAVSLGVVMPSWQGGLARFLAEADTL